MEGIKKVEILISKEMSYKEQQSLGEKILLSLINDMQNH